MEYFDAALIKKLKKPEFNSSGEDNGQLTIIGGSKLFHGAPLFALKIAPRVVDMVFFLTPDASVGRVAERIKSKLFSFIWVPWSDGEEYIKKSEAVLIGPGFMRFGSEATRELEKNYINHEEGILTRFVTETLLKKFHRKRWLIDGGSLQVISPDLIPANSIITPNKKEFGMLFNLEPNFENAEKMSQKYNCIVVLKGPEMAVCSPKKSLLIAGGNPGLTKGGSGDCLAGLTAALLTKNEPFLAACSAGYVVKKAADDLFKRVGTLYNSDDLAKQIPLTLFELQK